MGPGYFALWVYRSAEGVEFSTLDEVTGLYNETVKPHVTAGRNFYRFSGDRMGHFLSKRKRFCVTDILMQLPLNPGQSIGYKAGVMIDNFSS